MADEYMLIKKSTLTCIGDAVRAKEGTSADIPVTDLASRITALSSGGNSGGGNPTFAIYGYGLAWGGNKIFEYEAGMVWGSWIFSSYNTFGSDSFEIAGSDEMIFCNSYTLWDSTANAQVSAGDAIDSFHSYELQY